MGLVLDEGHPVPAAERGQLGETAVRPPEVVDHQRRVNPAGLEVAGEVVEIHGQATVDPVEHRLSPGSLEGIHEPAALTGAPPDVRREQDPRRRRREAVTEPCLEGVPGPWEAKHPPETQRGASGQLLDNHATPPSSSRTRSKGATRRTVRANTWLPRGTRLSASFVSTSSRSRRRGPRARRAAISSGSDPQAVRHPEQPRTEAPHPSRPPSGDHRELREPEPPVHRLRG